MAQDVGLALMIEQKPLSELRKDVIAAFALITVATLLGAALQYFGAVL